MSSYDAGDAFIQIVPSFRGVAEAIDRQAARWGESAGKRFAESFSAEVRRRTDGANLGPSDQQSTRQGGQSGSQWARGFRGRVAAERPAQMRVHLDTSGVTRQLAVLRSAISKIALGAAAMPVLAGGASLLGPGAAVGLGVAGVGAASVPGLENVAQARQAVTTAQAPGASVADRKKAAAAMAGLSVQERALLTQTNSLTAAYKSWGRSLEPATFGIFTHAMGALRALLPVVEPLIRTTAKALDQVVASIEKGVKSAGFTNFLGTLRQMAGPAIKGIAATLGNIGKTVGNVITNFAPLSKVVVGGLEQLTGGLAKAANGPGLRNFVQIMTDLGPTVSKTLGSVGGLVGSVFSTLAPLAKPVLDVVGTLAASLQKLIKGVGPSLQQMFADLAPVLSDLVQRLVPPFTQFINQLAPVIPQLAKAFADWVLAATPLLPIIATLARLAVPILDFLAPLAPFILGVVAAIKVWEIAQAAINLLLTANPIGLVVTALAALAAGFYLAWSHSATFRAVVTTAFRAVKTVVLGVINWFKNSFVPFFTRTIPGAFNSMLGWIKGAWSKVWAFLKTWGPRALAVLAPFIGIPLLIAQHFNQIKGWLSSTFSSAWRSVSGFVGRIVSAVKSIPGKIRSVGGAMLSAGKHLMSSLFDGLEHAAGAVGSFAAALGRAIVNRVIDGLNAILPHKLHIHIPIPAAPDVNINIPLIPEIPHIALGGMTTGLTAAIVGDNPSGRELIMPMDSPATTALLAQAMRAASQSPLLVGEQFAQMGNGGSLIRDVNITTLREPTARDLIDKLGFEVRRAKAGGRYAHT